MSRVRRTPALPSGDLDDFEAPLRVTPGHWLLLMFSAARRRKTLAVAVFVAAVAAVCAYYVGRTPLYRVETKILAQRQHALPSVARAAYEDPPTRSAWETVHRRENLLAIVRQTKLLDADTAAVVIRESRAAPGSSISGSNPEDVLVQILDKQLSVTAEVGTITISIDWPDSRLAYDIVQAALHNFLEARHVQEITAIDEVISVLQGRAAALREALNAAIEDARRRAARPTHEPASRVHSPSEELVRLQSLLAAKQRAIRDVEELRLRRVADLQAQLEQARNALSDAHPTMIGLRKDLEAASRESPQVQALREEERRARNEHSARLKREGFPGTVTLVAPPLPTPTPSEEDDPAVRQARLQYEQVSARVNLAQVELDAARAAFKYRYDVIWPPQLPTEPVSPNPKRIFGAGLLASLLLALGVAVAPDLWSGRIVQRWQVERSLDLPVIGEIRRRP